MSNVIKTRKFHIYFCICWLVFADLHLRDKCLQVRLLDQRTNADVIYLDIANFPYMKMYESILPIECVVKKDTIIPLLQISKLRFGGFRPFPWLLWRRIKIKTQASFLIQHLGTFKQGRVKIWHTETDNLSRCIRVDPRRITPFWWWIMLF